MSPHAPDHEAVLRRSECFAEDLAEFDEAIDTLHGTSGTERRLHWLVALLPLAVALVGVSAAVLPVLS